MKIGVLKDLKQGEECVGMTPENVKILTDSGYEVFVEKAAGSGAGFAEEEYIAAGAQIVTVEEAWNAELIVRVKEPIESEFKHMKPGQIIWGFPSLGN